MLEFLTIFGVLVLFIVACLAVTVIAAAIKAVIGGVIGIGVAVLFLVFVLALIIWLGFRDEW